MSTSVGRNGVSRDAEEAAAVRAALAELGQALQAASVIIEELSASSHHDGTVPPRFAWRAEAPSAAGAASPGPAAAGPARGEHPGELVIPIATGAGILGQLRIAPAVPAQGFDARDEAAARAVAHALAGLLARREATGGSSTSMHQLRAPLTAILAVSDIVRRYGERLSEEEKRHEMEKIQAQVRTLTRLLDEFAGVR